MSCNGFTRGFSIVESTAQDELFNLLLEDASNFLLEDGSQLILQ